MYEEAHTLQWGSCIDKLDFKFWADIVLTKNISS